MQCHLLVLGLLSLLGSTEETNVVPFTTKTGYYPLDSSTLIVGAMDGSIHGEQIF